MASRVPRKAKSPAQTASTPKPSAEAQAAASLLASRMPFVHFPSSFELEAWKTWGAFKSASHLPGGAPQSPDEFDVLRASHVFAYAGPCCFAQPKHHGDTAAYLDAEADQRWPGAASPFDSGALESSDARLQPWAQKTQTERWSFFQKHVHALATWRRDFEKWLLDCYDDPKRYTECLADRYEAGQPERLKPVTLLQHNGVRGRKRYATPSLACADRRAWTWEIRFSQPVPFEEIRLLHVPAHRQQAVLEAVRERRFGIGRAPQVLPLPTTVAASPEALYLHSQEALEELIKP